MNIAEKLRAHDMKFIEEMENYILKLKKQNIESPEESIEDARLALNRTGVTVKSKNKNNTVGGEINEIKETFSG